MPPMRNCFGGVTPFKVEVNFDTPLFKGKIHVDALEKWLNLLEDYFFVQKFVDSENITFALLNSLPHIKYIVGMGTARVM